MKHLLPATFATLALLATPLVYLSMCGCRRAPRPIAPRPISASAATDREAESALAATADVQLTF